MKDFDATEMKFVVMVKFWSGTLDGANEPAKLETRELDTETLESGELETEGVRLRKLEIRTVEAGEVETRKLEIRELNMGELETWELETVGVEAEGFETGSIPLELPGGDSPLEVPEAEIPVWPPVDRGADTITVVVTVVVTSGQAAPNYTLATLLKQHTTLVLCVKQISWWESILDPVDCAAARLYRNTQQETTSMQIIFQIVKARKSVRRYDMIKDR